MTSIEFLAAASKDEWRAVRVHFSTGKHQDFQRPEEVEALAEFLKAHPA